MREPADPRVERTPRARARKGAEVTQAEANGTKTRAARLYALPPRTTGRAAELQSSTTIRYFEGAQNSSGDSIWIAPCSFFPSCVSDEDARYCGLCREMIL